MEVVGKDIHSFQETVRDHSEYDFTQYSHTSLRRRLTRILLELELEMDVLTNPFIGIQQDHPVSRYRLSA